MTKVLVVESSDLSYHIHRENTQLELISKCKMVLSKLQNRLVKIQVRKVLAVESYHIHEEYSSGSGADVYDVALVFFINYY